MKSLTSTSIDPVDGNVYSAAKSYEITLKLARPTIRVLAIRIHEFFREYCGGKIRRFVVRAIRQGRFADLLISRAGFFNEKLKEIITNHRSSQFNL